MEASIRYPEHFAPVAEEEMVYLTGGSILVVKDSYANSLVPFLTANSAAVDVVDLRNYNYGLDALIEANGYDAILLLYSFDSFKADPYLYRAGIEG